ncbi:unnamed protein product [Chondrus crispus]|uniref:Uncharacterized protein n=1 Tax=Chondrus crispus TaxID=2769 RepID=R7QCZ0_CHOCR|nr:unnamed protein product [Chondrus crispus]CDF36372.1 unnamed protein product [Chondrus crispus]|eukprot:XP_005716191.1 unnamed protein product [Chondrus crispus]
MIGDRGGNGGRFTASDLLRHAVGWCVNSILLPQGSRHMKWVSGVPWTLWTSNSTMTPSTALTAARALSRASSDGTLRARWCRPTLPFRSNGTGASVWAFHTVSITAPSDRKTDGYSGTPPTRLKPTASKNDTVFSTSPTVSPTWLVPHVNAIVLILFNWHREHRKERAAFLYRLAVHGRLLIDSTYNTCVL